MTITVNTKTMKSYRQLPDSVTYAGPGNTLTKVDTLTFKRVAPKTGTAGYPGVARPSIKRNKDVVVDTVSGRTAPLVLDFNGSIPVGTSDADIAEALADLVSAAQNAVTLPLMQKLELPTS